MIHRPFVDAVGKRLVVPLLGIYPSHLHRHQEMLFKANHVAQ
jgi:hypothetical protein